MNVYANAFQMNINEVVTLDFRENSQTQNGSVARVVVLYEALKQIHAAIGQAIEDHDAKLANLKKAN
jgi:hypothetical protein